MRILLTNDDGYSSVLLRDIADYINTTNKDAEVFLFAPDKNCSGISGAMTFSSPLTFYEMEKNQFSVVGFPVDCVKLAQNYIGEFDLLVSGPNYGANLGSDLFYSGTTSAARQGAMYNIPSIAFSIIDDVKDPATLSMKDWHDFLDQKFGFLVELANRHCGCFINVNIPIPVSTDLREAKLAMRYYKEFQHIYKEEEKNNGDPPEYKAKNIFELEWEKMEEDTDWKLSSGGYSVFSVVASMPMSIPSASVDM